MSSVFKGSVAYKIQGQVTARARDASQSKCFDVQFSIVTDWTICTQEIVSQSLSLASEIHNIQNTQNFAMNPVLLVSMAGSRVTIYIQSECVVYES